MTWDNLEIMNANKKIVDDFLHHAGMSPAGINLESTVDHIVTEMHRGLAGESSSLAMIPTYISAEADVPRGPRAVVLDAGGTNLRVALVHFAEDGRPHIESYSRHPMPGTSGGPVSRDEFFSTLAGMTGPLVDEETQIGFCFSYPTEIYPDHDGRLIHWSKEIQAPEVEGQCIGSGLHDALSASGVKAPKVVILNDTVATLLAGKAETAGRNWSGLVGFILGTGTNTCYIESNSSIGKIAGLDPEHSQIVNCESGSYACRKRGEGDKALGAATQKPETYWLEKMVSGAYFGSLVAHTTYLACEAGIFSAALGKILESGVHIETKDADLYLQNSPDAASSLWQLVSAVEGAGKDAPRLWFLIDALLERAALLTAASLAAAVLKGRGRTGPLSPTCLTIDGTAYYRYHRFRERVESQLRPFLEQRDKYYESIQVNDAPLIGAAVAALTN